LLHCGPAPFLSEEDLRVILGEVARLEEIVQHFLDFARPAPARPRQADLCDLVSRPLELIRTRARQQGVEVEVRCPDEPVPLHADGGQVNTVLVNLLLNALDAMPRGGRLQVRVARDGPTARVEVQDNGPGIHPDLAGRLFTPFASTKPTGTGLGLSL